MIEGASIDKRAHAVDAERMIWDVIEFDRAVPRRARLRARAPTATRDPANDTLVIVTADHETGGMGIIGVGNERYAPTVLGKAVRDYAAVFRFVPEQELNFFPNYQVDERGFPLDPDPSRKLLLGWAAGPTTTRTGSRTGCRSKPRSRRARRRSASPTRRAMRPRRETDNTTVAGPADSRIRRARHDRERRDAGARPPTGAPADTASLGHTISGHTASDVPLSASGPGAWQFTGVYENTDVLLKILRATTGGHVVPAGAPGSSRGNSGTGRRP